MRQHKHGAVVEEKLDRREVFLGMWQDFKGLIGRNLPNISDDIKLIRPPGALDQLSFLSTCERCGKCIQACVEKAIKIAGPEQGPSLGTPYLIPEEQPCTFCLKCVEVCSSGALRKELQPQEYLIGKARINYTNCLAHNGQLCSACKNACPNEISAIKINSYLYPVIDSEKCKGCGLCASVCLAPIPAIIIEPII